MENRAVLIRSHIDPHLWPKPEPHTVCNIEKTDPLGFIRSQLSIRTAQPVIYNRQLPFRYRLPVVFNLKVELPAFLL